MSGMIYISYTNNLNHPAKPHDDRIPFLFAAEKIPRLDLLFLRCVIGLTHPVRISAL